MTRVLLHRASRGLPKSPFARRDGLDAAGLGLFADLQRTAFRRLLEESLQEVLEAQMTDFLGATSGERSRKRSGRRDGHRDRTLVTSLGELRLRLPRDRARQFRSELFDRYPGAERAVLSELATMHLRSVSVVRVRRLIEALVGRALSDRATGQVAAGVRAALTRFSSRPIATDLTRLMLASRRLRFRVDGVVQTKTVLTATGIDRTGGRHVLGVALAERASIHGATRMLRRLRARGRRRVVVIVRSDRDGPCRSTQQGPGPRIALGLLHSHVGRRAALRATRPARWAVWATRNAVAMSPPALVLADGRLASGEPIERSLAEPGLLGSGVAGVPSAPTPGPTIARGAVDRDSPVPDGEADVVWIRRGVERKLGGAPARADRRSHAGAPLLLGGLSLGFVALAVWSAVALLSVDTAPQEAEEAAIFPPQHALRPSAVSVTALPAGTFSPPTRAAPQSSSLRLTGVIAAKVADGPGIALISIGDGPPNPFRVGALVDQDLVLKAVKLDRAELGPADGAATLVLEPTYAAPMAAAADHRPGALGVDGMSPFGGVPSGISAPLPNRASPGDGAASADGALARDPSAALSAQKAREAQYAAAATRAAARRAKLRNQRATQ